MSSRTCPANPAESTDSADTLARTSPPCPEPKSVRVVGSSPQSELCMLSGLSHMRRKLESNEFLAGNKSFL